MAPTRFPLIATLFLLFSISLITTHCFKITTQLIHRDSHLSPLYNATASIEDRATRIVESSLARYAYLSADDIEAKLMRGAKNTIFYVKFSIGEPPVQQLALLDTGSDLLWLKCPPCTPCAIGSANFFYSFNSKTYSPRPCTPDCEKCTDPWLPWTPKHCMYTINYLDGQSSEGVYATDQLVFGTIGGGTSIVPKVVFGCCSRLTGPDNLDPQVNGILGLAGDGLHLPSGEKSVVTRLGSKFSYCVGSLSDPYYPYNILSFGDDAVALLGESTPLAREQDNYYVQLSGISLGDHMLDIKPQVLRKMSLTKRVCIDSGAELLYLYTDAFDVLKAEVQMWASWLMAEVSPVGQFELCYKGSVENNATEIPELGLHFVGGAKLMADRFGMFVQRGVDTFCLAVLRSKGLSIIGMMVQQGYNVGYDLRASQVYFESIDCKLLQR